MGTLAIFALQIVVVTGPTLNCAFNEFVGMEDSKLVCKRPLVTHLLSNDVPGAIYFSTGTGMAIDGDNFRYDPGTQRLTVTNLTVTNAPPPVAGTAALTYSFFANAPSNPADWGGSFIGCAALQTASSGVNRCGIPRTGTITSACLFVSVAAVLGSGEPAIASLRLNDASDVTISSAVLFSRPYQFYCAPLSIPVVQGGFFEIKIAFPIWVTNPTGVRFGGTVVVQ